MNFSASSDIITACRSYGFVFTQESPNPFKCHTVGMSTPIESIVGKKSTVAVQIVNFKGEPCEEPIKSFHCELVSQITSAKTKGSVQRKSLSQYEVNYQPIIKGRHQLHVEIDGQHIKGSPFALLVYSSNDPHTSPILTFGQLDAPWGVAVNHQSGEVFVTERGQSHCVSVFSNSGEKVNCFGKLGSLKGQFSNPHGIAVDGEGNVFIADCYNHRIQKFTADGQFVSTVGTEGDGPVKFSYPKNIAFNVSNNKLYVVDGRDCIQILNSDLTYFSSFGRYGAGRGHFNNPWGIACDSTGKVFVADLWNKRIQVFTKKGKFLRMFGTPGEGLGEIEGPTDIAIDNRDLLYISDIYTNRISVFTSEGDHVTSYGTGGVASVGNFRCLQGLAVDASGVVYACDAGEHCIKVL